MKIISIQFAILVLAIILFFSSISSSRIIPIYATNNNVFYPNHVDAIIGDTIKWTAAPFKIHHNTVCDGRPGTLLPAGASPWVSPILNLTGYIYVMRVAGFYRYICSIHPSMTGTINAVVTEIIPNIGNITDYRLYQNFPNPFNPVTKVKFKIPHNNKGEESNVKLAIYNSLGREIEILVNGKLSTGSYEVNFNGADLSGGIYFYKIEGENFSETKRMVLLK